MRCPKSNARAHLKTGKKTKWPKYRRVAYFTHDISKKAVSKYFHSFAYLWQCRLPKFYQMYKKTALPFKILELPLNHVWLMKPSRLCTFFSLDYDQITSSEIADNITINASAK